MLKLGNLIQVNSQNNHMGAKVSIVVVGSQLIRFVHTLIIPLPHNIASWNTFYKRTITNRTLVLRQCDQWGLDQAGTIEGAWPPSIVPWVWTMGPGHCSQWIQGNNTTGSICHLLYMIMTHEQSSFTSCILFAVSLFPITRLYNSLWRWVYKLYHNQTT